MDGGNNRVFELHPTSPDPFCLKNADGVMILDLSDSVAPKKIERDDKQVIVTLYPGYEGREHKFFFPFGDRGLEIIYGRQPFVRDSRNGRF